MIYQPTTDCSRDWPSGNWRKDTPDGKLWYFRPNPIIQGRLESDIVKQFSENWYSSTVHQDDLPNALEAFHGSLSNPAVFKKEFADLVEELDPGKHQIIEIANHWSKSDQVEIPGDYYLVNVYQTARTVDLEHTKLNRFVQRGTGINIVMLDSLTPETCTVYKSASEGRHLWRDDQAGAVFCSQEFRDRAKALQGGSGCVRFIETTVV